MGMYSKNRFSNLSAEAVEESLKIAEVKEADAVEPEEDAPVEIDDDIMAMFGGDDEDDEPEVDVEEAVSDFNDITLDENYSGLIESCIQITNDEQRVLEALMTLDAVSINRQRTLGEAVSEEANTAKKDKISEKISKITTGMKNSVEQSAARAARSVEKIVNSDSSIFQKYNNQINKKSLEGFPGIKNFKFPDPKNSDAASKATSLTDLQKAAAKAANAVKGAKDKASIDAAFSSFIDDLKNIDTAFKENLEKAMVKSDKWIPSEADIKFMKGFANSDSIKKAIAVNTKKATATIEALDKSLKSIVGSLGKAELDTYKALVIYRIASFTAKGVAKKFKTYTSLMAREVAAVRTAFLVCGRYAAKGKTAVNEFAIDNIRESSDLYVFDHFED